MQRQILTGVQPVTLIAIAGVGFTGALAVAAEPLVTFDQIWEVMDHSYAQFDIKGVDWDMQRGAFRSRITAETTDDELFEVSMDMLRTLNDPHVCLTTEAGRACSDVPKPGGGGFSSDLIAEKYLTGGATMLSGGVTFGWAADGVGYIWIRHCRTDAGDAELAIDQAMSELKGADAMIVDIRSHPGGADNVAELYAGRFADTKRHFMTGKTRYGAGHSDFLPPTYWNVEPSGAEQFTGPTVVLTNRQTSSAGDTLRLAFGVLPHVTVVGETTEGALGSQYPEQLANGWTLELAFVANLDNMGKSWDGIGIAPDVEATTTPADIAEGRDPILDSGLALIEEGGLRVSDESDGIATVRESLVKSYIGLADVEGAERAGAWLDEQLALQSDEQFLSVSEAFTYVQMLFGQGRAAECFDLLGACKREYPHVQASYGMLALLQLQTGDVDGARSTVAEADGVVAWYSWEAGFMNQAKGALGIDS